MTVAIVTVIVLLGVAACARFACLASISATAAHQSARDAAGFSRGAAEARAADTALIEVDAAHTRPLRLVHLDETGEQLVKGAIRRHPTVGRAR